MNMKEFAQYLTTVSFDEALHHARQLSHERVIANEQTFEAVRHETPQHSSKLPRLNNADQF